MRAGVTAALRLTDVESRLVGGALLARTAARHLLAVEGPSARAQSLISLSIGTFAVIDSEVTARMCAGLPRVLAHGEGGTVPLFAALGAAAAPAGELEPVDWSPESPDPAAVRSGMVFALVAARMGVLGLPVPPVIPPWATDGFRDVVLRQPAAPVGRLRIPVRRWLSIDDPELSVTMNAALDVIRRGADEVGLAMTDAYHWRWLHAGMAPVEPELLLAGMAVHAAARESGYSDQVEVEAERDPVVRAVLVASADLVPREWGLAREFGSRWGGEDRAVGGAAGDRLSSWRERVIGDSQVIHW